MTTNEQLTSAWLDSLPNNLEEAKRVTAAEPESPALSAPQRRLLDLMRQGYSPVIYNDDPRTRYLSPDRHPAGALRGNANVVLALLNRGLIEVKRADGGAVEYRLA